MKNRYLFFVALSLLCHAVSLPLFSQIRLPQIIRDSMILQRDVPVQIWGWASKGEKVTLSFQGRNYATRSSADGNWKLTLPALKAGGPYSMDIRGKNRIQLQQILVGDVWFCSGQSNMVHQMKLHNVLYEKEIAEANYPNIRQFWIPTLTDLDKPQTDIPAGSWKWANPNDVNEFSAVAYFFARQLYEKHHIPIGIVNASVGGTPIEAWTSAEGLKNFDDLVKTIQRNQDTAYINGLNRRTAGGGPLPQRPEDKGLDEQIKWFDPAYVPRHWRTINVPGYWEDQGIKELNGIVWYRREIELPAGAENQSAKLFLGRIVDADEVYINGRRVGNTTYQYPQRRYAITPGILKTGKNLIVVRVTNQSGKGGFVPDKPYFLFIGGREIDLKGYWQYKVGTVFVPRRPGQGFGGGGINRQNQPAALYNAMVAPFVDYRVKGFVWYQGESNAGRPAVYEDYLKALIQDWRKKWQDPELPFLYAQLPNFMDVNYLPEESNWALLREAQARALSVPNTAMTVNIDLGEWNDIHPDNKKDVGERLALAARKLAYGEDIVYSGPLYSSFTIEGNKIRVRFSHTGNGLKTTDGNPPDVFAIAGADKNFVWARTRIEGNEVVVWNESVSDPKYVRYAWADNPDNPNLINSEGLPASPFRTDQ